MLYLYHGGGAGDFELRQHSLSSEEWARLQQAVCRLLKARNREQAANLLVSIPFELFDATNGFGDEFSVLFARTPFEKYVELTEHYEEPRNKWLFQQIAITISEVASSYIRFIAVELDRKSVPEPVPTPNLLITSDTVEMALADAEQLIHSRGAISGVDRVHTAFHGYLRAVAIKAGIEVADDANAIQLFKVIQDQHPAFAKTGPRAEDITRIVRAMATILDALNPLRNRASIAHPNESLLEEPEAMLVINIVRTLLHYLNTKIQ